MLYHIICLKRACVGGFFEKTGSEVYCTVWWIETLSFSQSSATVRRRPIRNNKNNFRRWHCTGGANSFFVHTNNIIL